jgi:hypothetical protein
MTFKYDPSRTNTSGKRLGMLVGVSLQMEHFNANLLLWNEEPSFIRFILYLILQHMKYILYKGPSLLLTLATPD